MIKMKDMLALPVKRAPGGIMPFLKDGNDEVMFVGTAYHVDLCVTAINAYDDNQDEIKLLKVQLELARGHRDLAHQEIKSLKVELEQHDDQITNIEIVNQEMLAVADARINKQVDDNNELKAQVNAFIEEFSCFVAQHECNCGHPSCRTCKECKDAFKLLDKTPAQCLANFKTTVIKSTIADIEIGMANAYLDGDDILVYLKLELNKLKGQNNG